MKEYILTLFLLANILQLSSCSGSSSTSSDEDGEIDRNTLIESYTTHFKDLIFDSENVTDGIRPYKQKKDVKVFLHSSVSAEDKAIIDIFFTEINAFISTDILAFSYVQSLEESTIAIINGGEALVKEVYGRDINPPEGRFGAAQTQDFDGECQRKKSQIWYRDVNGRGSQLTGDYRVILLKHEILHALGLHHFDRSTQSIMKPDISQISSSSMTEKDKMALTLLYYNGPFGEVAANLDCQFYELQNNEEQTIINIVTNYLNSIL